MGNFAICKIFEKYKSLKYSMTFIPSMNDLLHGGNFCPSPEGKKEGGYQNSYSWHKQFIMQSIAPLDSGARFTERPGDWGMSRIIQRTFKSSLCVTHKRHHNGRVGAIDPGWIQGTQSFTLGKLQDQLFFWKWWWPWLEKEEVGLVLSLWQACSFHLSLSQEYGLQACLEEINFHFPCIQYSKCCINCVGLKLKRYYKD